MRLQLSYGILAVVLAQTTVFGWSNKEHMQLTRIAASRLIADEKTPPVMRDWLRKGLTAPTDMAAEKQWFMTKRIGIIIRTADPLPYWAGMPDMTAMTDLPSKKIEPWGVHERLLHYVDLEFFMADADRRVYRHDLSNKPRLDDIPDNPGDPRWARAGMLPFRVRECYQKLVTAIRDGKLVDTPGRYPRDEHAVRWAGCLAHYVADNTQPQHATVDYKSSMYFADQRKAPNVHSEMEYRMCDDDQDDYADLRTEFWPMFEKALSEIHDPIETKDLFRATLEVSMISYDALPMIGQAAMAAAGQAGTPLRPEGPAGDFDTRVFFRHKGVFRGREMTVMEMKAVQTAWAVKRIERVWLAAWAEATSAPTTLPADNAR